MTTILCDADIFAYRASQSNQNLTERKTGCFTLYANGNKACKSVDESVATLMEKLEADRIIMALSDKKNFRKKVLKTYKAHRKFVNRPLALDFVRDYIHDKYETLMLPELEGDDVIGILATGNEYVEGDKIIASIDKDFHTIPGTFYNLDKETIKIITEEEADYYHLYQTLTGDDCDGYKGCPQIGDKKARIALDTWTEEWLKPWEAVVCRFKQAGLTEEDALIQARVSRILRSSDYDWHTRTIKLWEPAV